MKFLEILKSVLPQVSIEIKINFNTAEQRPKEEPVKKVGGITEVRKD